MGKDAMNHNVFKHEAKVLFSEARKILVEKNSLYSPDRDALANFRHGGLTSIAYRISEKATRLKSLDNPLRHRTARGKDGIEDTLLDLLNYCAIGLLLIREKKIKRS